MKALSTHHIQKVQINLYICYILEQIFSINYEKKDNVVQNHITKMYKPFGNVIILITYTLINYLNNLV